jgi:hypothetical protein
MFLFDGNMSDTNSNIRINVHGKIIRGNHRFRIKDVADAAIALAGELGVVFEAIKYAE